MQDLNSMDISSVIDEIGFEEFTNIENDNQDNQSLDIHSVGNLTLPWWDNHSRAVPNGILRSALFGVLKKGPRRFVKEKEICANKDLSIKYTGEQLDQADLDVWEQCLHVFRNRDLDEKIEFTANSFLTEMGRGNSKHQYETLISSLKRLKTACFSFETETEEYYGNFINDIRRNKINKKFVLTFNKKIALLFGQKKYTKIDHEMRKKIGNSPITLWLFRFYSSHKRPFPMYVETIQKRCGSEDSLKSFKYNLKKALEKLSMLTGWTCWIDKSGKVYVQKTKQIEDGYSSKKYAVQTDVSDFEINDPSPF
jgi:hypothetical protein